MQVGVAVVNYLDLARRQALDENVLWLEVAMDHVLCMQHGERLQALARHLAQPLACKIFGQGTLLDVLVDMVQVVP